MNKQKLLTRLQNNCKNVNFNDFLILVEAYSFKHRRTNGSHHIYKNNNIGETLNLQEVKGEAMPYQIKKFLALVEKYNLRMES